MLFTFNAKTFKPLFESAVKVYISEGGLETNDEHSLIGLVTAMNQAIDVIERADSDLNAHMNAPEADAGTHEKALSSEDIGQIGDYALTLLEAIVAEIQDRTGQQDRDLIRLATPVVLWIAQHGGRVENLELAVNSLASYANELRNTTELAELSRVMRTVIDAAADNIQKDIEQTNPMRPWRVLNMNYGIVATRSHDPELIEQAYDALIKNLPQDARQFFREGMQQMDIVGYPQEVREVVERYDKMWGSDSTIH